MKHNTDGIQIYCVSTIRCHSYEFKVRHLIICGNYFRPARIQGQCLLNSSVCIQNVLTFRLSSSTLSSKAPSAFPNFAIQPWPYKLLLHTYIQQNGHVDGHDPMYTARQSISELGSTICRQELLINTSIASAIVLVSSIHNLNRSNGYHSREASVYFQGCYYWRAATNQGGI